MSDERVIRSGRHKGKRIVLASTSGLSRVRDESERFMREIFEMEPEGYLITDESSLYDFIGVDGEDVKDLFLKIRNVYGVEVSDVPGANLLEIIVRTRGVH